MNKRLFKLLLIYMVFATLRLYTQNTNDIYYYYKGEKTFLDIDYNRISIHLRGENAVREFQLRFKEKFPKGTLTEITQDYSETSVIEYVFDKNKRVKNQKRSNYFYTEASFSKTYSDKEYKNLLELYNKNDDIQAAPAFLTKEGNKMGLSNKFYVKLRKQEDVINLYEKAKELKVEILGRDKFMPLWFTLVVTKGSNKNALELANLFHETGIFEASEPAFVYHDLLHGSHDVRSNPNTLFSRQWTLENIEQDGGVSENENLVKIYPNPTNGMVHIDTKLNIEQIFLYDTNGKLVENIEYNKKLRKLNITKLRKGLYILKIKTRKEIIAYKVLKD